MTASWLAMTLANCAHLTVIVMCGVEDKDVAGDKQLAAASP